MKRPYHEMADNVPELFFDVFETQAPIGATKCTSRLGAFGWSRAGFQKCAQAANKKLVEYSKTSGIYRGWMKELRRAEQPRRGAQQKSSVMRRFFVKVQLIIEDVNLL